MTRLQIPENEPSRCCSPAPVAGATGTFDDVADTYWAFPVIEAVYAAGGTNGCSANPPYYCPLCRTTRAAAIAMLVRVAGMPQVNPATPTFSDVPRSHALYREIETAVAQGITAGCGGGRFCPDDPAPRWAVAIFTARAFGLPSIARGHDDCYNA